jgi:hypothetical protein
MILIKQLKAILPLYFQFSVISNAIGNLLVFGQWSFEEEG